MPKRRTLTKQSRLERGSKPKGPSKYALKGRLVPTGQSATSNQPPAPFHTNKNGAVRTTSGPVAVPKNNTIRVTAIISGIYLRKGFIILQNEVYPKIYMSDGTLTRYDRSLIVAPGDTVECCITLDGRGPRVARIIQIKQNT